MATKKSGHGGSAGKRKRVGKRAKADAAGASETRSPKAAVRENEDRYRLLVENASEAILVARDGRLEFVNRMAVELSGYSEQELLSRPFIEFVHPDDRGLVTERHLRRLRGDASQPRYAFRLIAPDGGIRWVEIAAVFIDWEGKPATLNLLTDITERRRAAEELQKLASVVRYSSELVNLATLDGKMIFLNEAGSRILGISPAEVEQCNIMQVIPAHLKEKVETELLPAVRGAGTWEGDLQYLNLKTGQLTDVHAMTFVVRDLATGAPLYLANVSRDITESKRAEEALAQERFLLQALMNNVPDHVYFKDRDSRLIRISKALAQAFGVSDPAQSVGKTDFDFFTEEHARQAYEDEQAIMRTGQPVSKEERETWADRPDTWVSTTKVPLRDEEGNVVGTFGISRDITERKRAEEALKNSLSLVEATLESTDNGILVVSREGAVVKANGRFAEMWRIPGDILASGEDEALLNHVLSQLSDPDAFLAKVKAVYRDPRAESADLLYFKDGRVFERISKPMLVGGEPKATVWSFLDITDRKRAEAEQAELEARNRQLQKAESLSRMAGAIAHHFNNQLQAVLLNLELAKGDLLQNAGPARCVTEAMMAANQAAEMSKLMLTYLGQTPGVRESLDLSIACGRWLSLLEVALPKHVVLKTDLASPGPTIRADAGQMRQVLTHLVTNAWEAGGAGRGEIRVTVKAVTSAAVPLAHRVPPDWQPLDPAYACLEVVDHGCGVAETDIEKLFDPFYSSKFTGRGLGLAVVLGIVRAHGGAVTVESTLGLGSAFRVYLPVSD